MTPEQQIERLFKKHRVWVSFARSYLSSANLMHSEDIVQECYIKLLRILRAEPDKMIKDNYFFSVIKSMIFDDQKRALDPLKNAFLIKDTHSPPQEEKPSPDVSEIISDIDEVVETFYHFDKLLFNAYRYEFKSIRKLSQATKIGHVQVFQTVKRCKEKINDKLKFKYYGKE